MKTDTFTKTVLGVIAVALLVIASRGALNQGTSVHAATTGQAYEYKHILRFMRINGDGSGYIGVTATWKEDFNEPPQGYTNDDAGLGGRIRDLGSEGWEMFAVVPYSNFRALAGVTTTEEYIFKRKH